MVYGHGTSGNDRIVIMVSGDTGDFKTLVAKISVMFPILLIWVDDSYKGPYCHEQHYDGCYDLYETSFEINHNAKSKHFALNSGVGCPQPRTDNDKMHIEKSNRPLVRVYSRLGQPALLLFLLFSGRELMCVCGETALPSEVEVKECHHS